MSSASSTTTTAGASSIGPNHRNSVSPSPNVHSGRASAPAVGSGRSKTPTSTPIHGNSSSGSDLEQRIAAFERLATAHAMQSQEMLFNPTPQQLMQQRQHYEAAVALQNQSAGQMVGRQGAIKDVRSIIEDYRQQHPESVPRRGRRMKTVPTTNASLMHSSGSSSSLLMLMANQNNIASSDKSSCIATSADEVDIGGFVLGEGNDGGGGPVVNNSELLGGGGRMKNLMKKGRLSVDSGGGGCGEKAKKTSAAATTEKVKRVKDASRRGCEWQAMLDSLSESGTTATSILSRPASAESSSSASASAINSLLTQHGLLPAISVTSLGSGGGVSLGAETGAAAGGVSANGNVSFSVNLPGQFCFLYPLSNVIGGIFSFHSTSFTSGWVDRSTQKDTQNYPAIKNCMGEGGKIG